MKKVLDADKDLPIISLEIGLGRERKSIVNFYYREWTGIVSGRDEQEQRLSRIIQHWRTLVAEDRDILLLGDANLCALSWNDPNYSEKALADIFFKRRHLSADLV